MAAASQGFSAFSAADGKMRLVVGAEMARLARARRDGRAKGDWSTASANTALVKVGMACILKQKGKVVQKRKPPGGQKAKPYFPLLFRLF
jgi:hypothetical protein